MHRALVHRVVLAAVATSALASNARAQLNGIDSVKVVVQASEAVGAGTQLTALGYVPATDSHPATIYTGFNGGIRKIDNPDAPGATGVQLVNKTPWTTWQQDIHTNGDGMGGGQPITWGLALNPVQVGTSAPYTLGLFTDTPTTVTDTSPVAGFNAFNTMKRLYSYNLQAATPNLTDESGGYTVFTPVMTAAQHYAAAGLSTTPNVAITQPAFSYDGVHSYFIDGTTTSTAMRGIYRTDLVNGGTARISADIGRTKVDFAVKKVDDATDRLYLTGTATTGGQDGLVAVDYTTAGALGSFGTYNTLVSQDAIRTLFNAPATVTYGIDGIAVDGDNVYFAVSGGSIASPGFTSRNAILRYDGQGRLAKVLSFSERRVGFTSTTTAISKFQIRDAAYAGAGGSSTQRQLLFADGSGYVGGIWLFEPGDFNHDGAVNADDATAFKQPGIIQLQGTTTTDKTHFVYDLNANVLANTASAAPIASHIVGVDYTDVKKFQEFYVFPDGDADFSQTVDFNDLVALAQHYNTTGNVWTQGEFTGDTAGLVDFNDLVILAQHYNQTTAPGALNGFSAQFQSDWTLAQSFVPEPTTLLAAAVSPMLVGRRRRGVA